ncbi:MAG TPA: hypothetical protein PLV52_05010, partial [Candidatus Omnitrophota bacterium]|nr:hypothetical protein [Candidatus Omnitrophota bacterium]
MTAMNVVSRDEDGLLQSRRRIANREGNLLVIEDIGAGSFSKEFMFTVDLVARIKGGSSQMALMMARGRPPAITDVPGLSEVATLDDIPTDQVRLDQVRVVSSGGEAALRVGASDKYTERYINSLFGEGALFAQPVSVTNLLKQLYDRTIGKPLAVWFSLLTPAEKKLAIVVSAVSIIAILIGVAFIIAWYFGGTLIMISPVLKKTIFALAMSGIPIALKNRKDIAGWFKSKVKPRIDRLFYPEQVRSAEVSREILGLDVVSKEIGEENKKKKAEAILRMQLGLSPEDKISKALIDQFVEASRYTAGDPRQSESLDKLIGNLRNWGEKKLQMPGQEDLDKALRFEEFAMRLQRHLVLISESQSDKSVARSGLSDIGLKVLALRNRLGIKDAPAAPAPRKTVKDDVRDAARAVLGRDLPWHVRAIRWFSSPDKEERQRRDHAREILARIALEDKDLAEATSQINGIQDAEIRSRMEAERASYIASTPGLKQKSEKWVVTGFLFKALKFALPFIIALGAAFIVGPAATLYEVIAKTEWLGWLAPFAALIVAGLANVVLIIFSVKGIVIVGAVLLGAFLIDHIGRAWSDWAEVRRLERSGRDEKTSMRTRESFTEAAEAVRAVTQPAWVPRPLKIISPIISGITILVGAFPAVFSKAAPVVAKVLLPDKWLPSISSFVGERLSSLSALQNYSEIAIVISLVVLIT